MVFTWRFHHRSKEGALTTSPQEVRHLRRRHCQPSVLPSRLSPDTHPLAATTSSPPTQPPPPTSPPRQHHQHNPTPCRPLRLRAVATPSLPRSPSPRTADPAAGGLG